jgi:acetyl-CoA carboxylase biotin carboxyl carrier protein
MDLSNIKKLIKMIEESSITDFSIEENDIKISISKKSEIIQTNYQSQHNDKSGGSTGQPTDMLETKKNENSDFHEVCSPIVGSFYRAPAPDADSYVQIGDHISAGAVLCIVEAMKLMNEIESDISGTIVKVLVDNGMPVEYNQPLFLVKPD